MEIKNYFDERNIIIENNKNTFKSKEITNEKIKNQIDIIGDFHNRTKGTNPSSTLRLQSFIGKKVESYRLNVRRVKRYYKGLKNLGSQNEFEGLFLKCADEYIYRSERSISEVNECNYLKLIERSMENNEICLHKTYFNNLRREGNKIYVRDTSKLGYDMVEVDGIYFLSKMKRRVESINFNELLELYCTRENLDENSFKFINALLSYPERFINTSMKYFTEAGDFDESEYISKLRQSIYGDGKSIL